MNFNREKWYYRFYPEGVLTEFQHYWHLETTTWAVVAAVIQGWDEDVEPIGYTEETEEASTVYGTVYMEAGEAEETETAESKDTGGVAAALEDDVEHVSVEALAECYTLALSEFLYDGLTQWQ